MIRKPKTYDDIRRNREEWAAALESGDYEQGDGQLRSDDSTTRDGYRYCCLGVLQHLLDPGALDHVAGNEYPDDDIIAAVGVTHKTSTDLAVSNDEGTPFPDIARMILALPLPGEVAS